MSARGKGLLADLILYAAAFGLAAVPFALIDDLLVAEAAFTAVATGLVFLGSCVLRDVSVYDPYWSVAPPVMLLAAAFKYRLWNLNILLLFLAVLVWAVRLTGNWFVTYRGIGLEDWRYAQYRRKLPAPLFLLVSFFGLHFVPTAAVYAGMIAGFLAVQRDDFTPLSLTGLAVMLAAVALEFVADRAIHTFLREQKGERRTCDVSVWRYSRHPNYLGEMAFWTGLFLYYLPLCPREWYKGLGFLAVVLLFLTVSIPMMEKHNAARRPDYAAYRAGTSMLLLLPPRK